MSKDAEERLLRWLAYVGPNAPEDEEDIALRFWEQGVEPPFSKTDEKA